jgi:hypothetical protein
MKKNLRSVLYFFVLFIVLNNIVEAQNVYFREGFQVSDQWPSAAAAATPRQYVLVPSGVWYTFGAYKTNGSTGACTTQTGDANHARFANLTSVVTGYTTADSAFLITPVANFGINTLTFYNGRAARRFTISKTSDTAATTTNWVDIINTGTTNAACDFFTVTINDLTAKRLKITSRSGTDSDLDSLVMTSINTITPVKYKDFTASLNNGLAKLSWNVAAEINTSKYIIEKSVDGINFNTIGEITAINASKYSFIDYSPINGANFYRTKAFDHDGLISYSPVVKLSTKIKSAEISVAPNPVVGQIANIQCNNFVRGNYVIHIFNQMGQELFSKSYVLEASNSVIPVVLPNSVTKGIYKLTITNASTVVSNTINVQ